MKTKKNLIKKIFTIILFINSLIIVAQESNQTNSAIKEWIIDDYITFSEKAVKDCYKLEINKIRLIDRIDLLLKNNKIDEKTHSENKKKIESEQDVLLNFYKGEIEFEISHIKKFCEKELANLYNTTQEKKTEYILQKIEQDFASYYNQEKKYLEINPIDKPKSVPNNGSDTSWSIDDYDKFVQNETDNCPNLLIQKKDNAKEKLDKGINKLKSDKYKQELNKISVDENEFNKSIKNLEYEYEKQIENLKTFCNEHIDKTTKYRDEWVTYLKVKPIYDNLFAESTKNKLEIEEENRKKRVIYEDEEKIKKNKIEKDLLNAKTNETLNSIEYKNWKTKYLSIINSADANILIINNLEKKYSFRNSYGNKVFDPSSFSQQDKINYNKNYDAIKNKLDNIRELQKIGKNEYFENLYTDSVITSTSKGLELSILAQFYNSHEKLY